MRIIAGKYRGKKLLSPISQETRPTSDRAREMIFDILLHNPAFGPTSLIDKNVLDVFAGVGALGLEALSRGAKSITFIENSRTTLPILYTNLKAFDLSSPQVLERDALSLGKAPSPFDVVFLDPPYMKGLVLPTLTQLFLNGWLAHKAVVVIEISKNESLEMPSFLSLELERSAGAAKIMFCSAHIY